AVVGTVAVAVVVVILGGTAAVAMVVVILGGTAAATLAVTGAATLGVTEVATLAVTAAATLVVTGAVTLVAFTLAAGITALPGSHPIHSPEQVSATATAVSARSGMRRCARRIFAVR